MLKNGRLYPKKMCGEWLICSFREHCSHARIHFCRREVHFFDKQEHYYCRMCGAKDSGRYKIIERAISVASIVEEQDA